MSLEDFHTTRMSGKRVAVLRNLYYGWMQDAMKTARRFETDFMKQFYVGYASGMRGALAALDSFTDSEMYFEHGNGD